MHPIRTALVLLALLTLGGATMAIAGPGERNREGPKRHASAALKNAEGDRVGRVWFSERRRDGSVWVAARVRGLPAGFHGFHIHATGRCDAPDFTSAMGHLREEGQVHGDHVGDLPVLLVNADGTGELAAVSDRFEIADLRDADGSAVIVHELPDNYANIPTRYAPQPDQATLDTGDAGARLACGKVR